MTVEIFKHIDDGTPLQVVKPFETLAPFNRMYLIDTKGNMMGVAVEPSAELLRELLKFGYSSGIVYLK